MAAGQTTPYTPPGVPSTPSGGTPSAPPAGGAPPSSPDGGSAQNPTPQWLRNYAKQANWSEDFERFTDAQLWKWLRSGNWDPNAKKFRSEKTDRAGNRLEGFVEKPSETPEGWTAWGAKGQAVRTSELPGLQAGGAGPGSGAGGGFGGAGGFGGGGAAGMPTFTAPTLEQALQDPGYKFSLQQGVNALENSAAARGTLRTGGTLSDIIQYGQDAAAKQYGDVYNRALSTYGAQLQPWQTTYQGDLDKWRTKYNADLQKWITKENNLAQLLSGPAPTAPSAA